MGREKNKRKLERYGTCHQVFMEYLQATSPSTYKVILGIWYKQGSISGKNVYFKVKSETNKIFRYPVLPQELEKLDGNGKNRRTQLRKILEL